MWFIVLLSKKYRQKLCDYIAHTALEAIYRLTYSSKYPIVYINEFLISVSGSISDNTNIDELYAQAYQLIKDYQCNCDLVQMIRVVNFLLNKAYFMKTDS